MQKNKIANVIYNKKMARYEIKWKDGRVDNKWFHRLNDAIDYCKTEYDRRESIHN